MVLLDLCPLLSRLACLCFEINCPLRSAAFAAMALCFEKSAAARSRMAYLEIKVGK